MSRPTYARTTAQLRKQEAGEYAGTIRRFIRALARRAAEGDIESFAALVRLRDDLDARTTEAAQALYTSGQWSWAEVGAAVGITKQGARQRWGRDLADRQTPAAP